MAKQMDTDIGAEEEEIVTSEFTAAEVWSRLPHQLTGGTFGYLNLQEGQRLCRVSYGWKTDLSRHAIYNNGLIFFQWPKTISDDHEWASEDDGKLLWGEKLLLADNTIDHFVLLEKSNDRDLIDYEPLCNKLISSHHPLTTITIIGYHGFDSASYLNSLVKLVQEKCKVIRFVDCSFGLSVSWFETLPDSDNEDWDPSSDVMATVRWEIRVPPCNKLLDRKMVQAMEAKTPVSESELRRNQMFNTWLLPKTRDELTKLFWPYPNDQLEWLKNCLSTLGCWRFPMVMTALFKCIEERKSTFDPETEGMLKKVGVRWKDRSLDVVDCAFLARMMKIVPEIPMIPPLPEPPHDVPYDFTVYEP